jgi:hypothetical protein
MKSTGVLRFFRWFAMNVGDLKARFHRGFVDYLGRDCDDDSGFNRERDR